MKKLKTLSLLLSLLITLGSLSAVAVSASETEDVPPAEEVVETYEITPLEGKKIMVIGNSMLYYGNCVNYGSQGGRDTGYLYRLITSNGENATVVDHTYPGKTLSYIYETYLINLTAEELASYDYVVMSEAAKTNDNFLADVQNIMALFGDTTKFYYMAHPMLYEYGLVSITFGYPTLREMGVEIVDWGGLVYDIYTSAVSVPNATLGYNRETFIKNNIDTVNGAGHLSEGNDGDDKHPNPLSGYIAAQMLYSALTHRPAEFQDYSFCGDSSLHKYFTFEGFISAHYNGEKTTNFDKVFESSVDMHGIQMLIDEYNCLENRHCYVLTDRIEPTCFSTGFSEGICCGACGKVFVEPEPLSDKVWGHSATIIPYVEPTCTVTGRTFGSYCSVCKDILIPQKEIAALGHTKKTTVEPAKIGLKGKTTVSCSTCGEIFSSKKIYRIEECYLSTTDYIYSGEKRKPSVTVKDYKGVLLEKGIDYDVSYASGRTKVGKYKVTIKFKGNYKGSTSLYFTIHPKTVNLKSVTAGSKKLTVRWSKVSGATGYWIQCSTSSSFEKDSTKKHKISSNSSFKKVLKNLKANKKYYIRMRAYKVVNGKTIYGKKFSNVISAKTKK